MNHGTVWKGMLPWAVLVFAYFIFAYDYNQTAPGSRIFPTWPTFVDAFTWMFKPLPVVESRPIVVDTLASLQRLFIALSMSIFLAVSTALLLDITQWARSYFLPLIITLAKIPVIALLPLVLAWGGYGEATRIGLVLLGIVPVMTLVIFENLTQDHRVLAWKLDTLHLPLWQVVWFVKMPMMIQHSALALQSQLGPAWLFLLVAETFGTETGLGYRINIFRSRNWMDITILYVVWIAIIAILLYLILDLVRKKWSWTWK